MSARYELTEGTMVSLRYALDEVRRSAANSRSVGNGRVRGRWPSPRSNRWFLESGLVRMVTIVESYVDAMSLHRLTTSPNVSSATKGSREQIFLESTKSWAKRQAVYFTHHQLDLYSCNGFKGFKCATTVRNSIAHGLGKLTSMQIKEPLLVNDCAVVGVHVGSGRVHVTCDSLELVAGFCESFVLELDQKMPL
jgi:hypothetical protein